MNIDILTFVFFLAAMLFTAVILMAIRDFFTSQNPVSQRAGQPGTDALPERVRPATPKDSFDRWLQRLETIQVESGSKLEPGVASWMAVLAGIAIGGALLVVYDEPILAIAGMAAGVIAVVAYFIIQRSRRLKLIRESLPGAMESIARAVRAGESVEQSIALVSENMPDPLASEFRLCSRQLDMGLPLEASMKDLAGRAPIPEMRVFATTLAVQRETGGNLPVTLRRLARVIRNRISYHRRYRAATAAGRFAGFFMTLAIPCIGIYLFYFHASYVEPFFESLGGRVMLAAAAGLVLVGFGWILAILKNDY